MSRLRKVGAFLGLVPDDQDHAARGSGDGYDIDYHSEYDDHPGYDDDADRANYRSYDDSGEAEYADAGQSGYAASYAGAPSYGVGDRTEQIPTYTGSGQPFVTAGGGGRGRNQDHDYPVQGALAVQPEVRTDAVAELVPAGKPTTITLTGFADAREVGETYRGGQAVILDMTDLTDAEARRMVDFAAGLAFAVRGSIDKVTQKVFMLHPPTAEPASG